MTSKEYLSQIYNSDHKIYLMRLEAEEYRRLSYSLPGQDFTKPFVKSSNPNTEAPFMKWLVKALDKEKEIEDLLKKMEELTNDITNTIDEVENLDYRVLLKLRYINQMTICDISERMHISIPTAKRWHREALEVVVVPEKYRDL